MPMVKYLANKPKEMSESSGFDLPHTGYSLTAIFTPSNYISHVNLMSLILINFKLLCKYRQTNND